MYRTNWLPWPGDRYAMRALQKSSLLDVPQRQILKCWTMWKESIGFCSRNGRDNENTQKQDRSWRYTKNERPAHQGNRVQTNILPTFVYTCRDNGMFPAKTEGNIVQVQLVQPKADSLDDPIIIRYQKMDMLLKVWWDGLGYANLHANCNMLVMWYALILQFGWRLVDPSRFMILHAKIVCIVKDANDSARGIQEWSTTNSRLWVLQTGVGGRIQQTRSVGVYIDMVQGRFEKASNGDLLTGHSLWTL